MIGNKIKNIRILEILILAFLFTNYLREVEVEGASNAPSAPAPRHVARKYDPKWASLDARPIPHWYDEAKIGILVCWGVFSVPAYREEWFWWYLKQGNYSYVDYMKKNFKPGSTYQEFAPQFSAELFDASKWAKIFQKSGVKYVVLTTKHHDGYALWNSSHGFNWNSMDVGPHMDIVGAVSAAVRKVGLKFGAYHSLMEWFQPDFLQDEKKKWTTREFPLKKLIPTLKELVVNYKPDLLWSDGEWMAPDSYWGSEEFLAWLYNDSPVKDIVVTNDRWGDNTRGLHGGFFNHKDHYNPGKLQTRKFENVFSLDKASWGYRKDLTLEEVMTAKQLIYEIVTTISCGGNVLVNVGATKEGTIPLIFEERLNQMGEWLHINREAVYESVPWKYQKDEHSEGVWYATDDTKTKIFAYLLHWPGTEITLSYLKPDMIIGVTMLGHEGPLKFSSSKAKSDGVLISLPRPDEIKSSWAWTIVIKVNHLK